VRGRNWSPKHRAPYTAVLIVLWTILVFATLFYFLSAHNWGWTQCIYFCIVTFSTVGYGDYVPEDSILDQVLLLFFLWFNMLVVSVVWSIAVTSAEKEIDELEGKKANDVRIQGLWLLVFILFGSALFMYLESWSFLQAITFTSVTLTTVGYGFLLPDGGAASMICASIFILVGVPLTTIFTGKIGAAIDEKFKHRKQEMSTTAQLGVYLALITIWLFAGTAGFHFLCGRVWSWSECFYLAAVTMTTVGYGDYVPEATLPVTLLCIIYIWGSVCVIGTVLHDLDVLLVDHFTKGMKRFKAMLSRVGFMGFLILLGVVVFDLLEGWGVLNSFVYTSVTCSTVGFGRLYPSTEVSRGWAVAFILLGVPLFGTLVSSISSEYKDEFQHLIAD